MKSKNDDKHSFGGNYASQDGLCTITISGVDKFRGTFNLDYYKFIMHTSPLSSIISLDNMNNTGRLLLSDNKNYPGVISFAAYYVPTNDGIGDQIPSYYLVDLWTGVVDDDRQLTLSCIRSFMYGSEKSISQQDIGVKTFRYVSPKKS